MFGFGALGTLLRLGNVAPQLLELALANGELQAEPGQLALRLLMPMSQADDFALRVALPGGDVLERCLGFEHFRRDTFHCSLHIGHARFERRYSGVERAEFAFHAEGASFIRTSAGDHAALI